MYKIIESTENLNRDLWMEIDLGAIAHNMRVVRKIACSPLISAVVKADGYGHGAVAVAQTLLDNGADRFSVATPDEAFELREHFEDIPILILSEVDAHLAPELARKNIAVTVASADKLRAVCCELRGSASPLLVHIKVDTGMGRIGFEPSDSAADEISEVLRTLNQESAIYIEGVFSHFAKADDEDLTFSHIQARRFLDFVDALKMRGIEPEIKHMANSAAIINLPEYHFDMVRAGILLFGTTPTGERFERYLDGEIVQLRPALSVKSRATFVKKLDKESGIGYCHAYIAEPGEVIITVPAGYADGVSRTLSGKLEVLVGGRRCRQVGNICMDQMMVKGFDGAKAGDEIILVGSCGSDAVTIEEIARKMGTLNYEVMCMFSKRIPRVYLK